MDEGIAHVCNIRNNMTVLKHKIDKNIPKKKSGFI
jgi:stalled ribosome rescue protein Dom34